MSSEVGGGKEEATGTEQTVGEVFVRIVEGLEPSKLIAIEAQVVLPIQQVYCDIDKGTFDFSCTVLGYLRPVQRQRKTRADSIGTPATHSPSLIVLTSLRLS